MLCVGCSRAGITDHTLGGVYTLNSSPAMTDSHSLDYFSFLGRCIGLAVRGSMQLGLALPKSLWKSLVGAVLTDADVLSFNKQAAQADAMTALIACEAQLNAIMIGVCPVVGLLLRRECVMGD